MAGDKVMLAQKELEIKLEGAPSALRRLNGIPLIKALNKPPKRATEVSVYFDTDKHKLHKKGLLLLRCICLLMTQSGHPMQRLGFFLRKDRRGGGQHD